MRAIVPLGVAVTMLILGFLFHAVVTESGEKARLQISVRPRVAFAPSDLYIQIRLQPQDEDRTLRVFTDGENFSRLSAWELQGSQSPKLYTVEWRSVYGGEYDVIAQAVNRAGRVNASAVERIILQQP